MTEKVIDATSLGFAYHKESVLQDINLTVYAGEIFGLVGADGAGKSTLLQLGVGQLQPGEGHIQVLGKDATDPILRDDIAYMPQGFGLYPDLSVQENMEFFADLHGLPAQQSGAKIRDLLKRTGLGGFESRRGGNLSGGMMQKLALACVLVHDPKVMFLDEPTTGVDPLSRRAFWQLIDNVRAEGVAILYATANMDEAERCDRVGLLEAGNLTRQGTPVELAQQDESYLVAVHGDDVRGHRNEIKQLPGVELAFPMGLRLNVWLMKNRALEDFQQSLKDIAADLRVESMTASLHDATLRNMVLAEQQ
ncbi:MAG: ATP-binding cassette domain-containing protein [Gammaproteobacteria bacterium]|jgi:ABC-2 type transport system ATP-binding protein